MDQPTGPGHRRGASARSAAVGVAMGEELGRVEEPVEPRRGQTARAIRAAGWDQTVAVRVGGQDVAGFRGQGDHCAVGEGLGGLTGQVVGGGGLTPIQDRRHSAGIPPSESCRVRIQIYGWVDGTTSQPIVVAEVARLPMAADGSLATSATNKRNANNRSEGFREVRTILCGRTIPA